jgi:release factor glutamine methyltransferase
MKHRISTVGALLAACRGDIRRDAEILLGACLGVPRATLLARPELEVALQAAERFAALLERRGQGEPVAYLTGEKEFWSLALRVTPDVLVPRPETETLIEAALAAGRNDAACDVVDLGTGSGAIAIALARERPQWRITATDVSEAALAVARRNADRLCGARIEFLSGDWYQPLAARRFDLIVSNPPYIAAEDAALRTPELGFEPQPALVAGVTGLEALAVLIAQAPRHLKQYGQLVVEHGSDQAPAVRSLLGAAGFSNIRTHRDLAGHERVTAGRLGTHNNSSKPKGSTPP